MSKKPVWRVLGLLLSICPTGGCKVDDLGSGGGPGYSLDTSKIGTGRQVITPSDDAQYWNGQPRWNGQSMDNHTHR